MSSILMFIHTTCTSSTNILICTSTALPRYNTKKVAYMSYVAHTKLEKAVKMIKLLNFKTSRIHVHASIVAGKTDTGGGGMDTFLYVFSCYASKMAATQWEFMDIQEHTQHGAYLAGKKTGSTSSSASGGFTVSDIVSDYFLGRMASSSLGIPDKNLQRRHLRLPVYTY